MNFHLHISGQDLQVVEFLRAVDSFHRLDWEQRGTFFLPLGKFLDEEALVAGTDCRHQILVDPDVVVQLSTGLGHTHVLLEESIMRSAHACVCPVDAASRASVLAAFGRLRASRSPKERWTFGKVRHVVRGDEQVHCACVPRMDRFREANAGGR